MIMNPHIMSRAVREAYRRSEDDETMEPLVLCDADGGPVGRIRRGDGVIFYNIRGEREVELTRSLIEAGFDPFPVEKDLSLTFVTMIEYDTRLTTRVAFPPEGAIPDTLSEVLSKNGIRQVKITEAEKAFHVGYFLNGKVEEPFPGEERVVLPTRKDVRLFDEAPEMSIEEITKAVTEKILDPRYRFIFVNFPNVDVVGHIENEAAVTQAVEAVDRSTGVVIEAARKAGVTVIVTADHGTVEQWLYPDGSVDTGHTRNPVPFILVDERGKFRLRDEGELADIAPTVLELLGLQKPEAMTGTPLVERGFRPVERLLVLILDGWGINDRRNGNLIARAATPVMDGLLARYPNLRLKAAGTAVGLPEGAVGNSEAGHLHIGAGRRVYSDRLKIETAVSDGSFFRNEAFRDVMDICRSKGTALHLMGIVSFFSSHGSIDHLFALMDMARKEGLKDLFIHAMLGRRGEMPESGANYVEMIEKKAAEISLGRVVSVIGRYWSMDREENWDRIEKTYRMLVYGDGRKIPERG
jgi:2,3-bisphosphoglycerate-independent phosphoglycerate mutase